MVVGWPAPGLGSILLTEQGTHNGFDCDTDRETLVSEATVKSAEPPFTVLIAEDEAPVREAYRIWLSDDDRWECREAVDGEEAVEALDESVDVLVLDRNMPKLSGSGVIERLDDTAFEGDVIVVSAYEPDATLDETDVTSYLTKPVREEQFRTLLDQAARCSDDERG